MPAKMTETEAKEWIQKKYDRYELLKWGGTSSAKSLFFDKNRQIEFECEFSIFKRNLKRNPDCIFNPTSEEKKESIRNSNIEKYGVDHPLKLKRFKNKIEETNLKKYGQTNIMKSKLGKERLKKTLQERYGVDHYSKTDSFKEKIKTSYENKSDEEKENIVSLRKETMIEKYGKDSPLKIREIKEKIKQTNIEKYGVENPLQSEEIKNKVRKTNLEKYDVEWTTQSEEVKEKIKRSNIENGRYKIYEKKLLKEWSQEVGFSRTHFNKLVNEFGFEQAIKLIPKESSLETLIKNFLEEKYIEYSHNRKFNSYRPDFKIEEKKLIIECDGLYWHSDIYRDKNYHIQKKKAYESNDYASLFFREDEIRDQFDIVKSIINNRLGVTINVGARKCEIREVPKKESNEFLKNSHLMGPGSGRSYGLYYKNDLRAMIQVKWKKKKEKLLEISRFCTKLNHGVVGGWSKLIKHIIKKESPNKIITFIDKRYGTGNYLKAMGWKKESEHISFHWTDGGRKFHRMRFPGNSGYEYGLAKIWDCGQAKYSLVLE